MKYKYLTIEDANKIANYDKLREENRMLKSNEMINNQRINELKNKHKKELEFRDKRIKELEEENRSLKYKQADIFGG